MNDNTNKTYTDEEIKSMNVNYEEVKPREWYEEAVHEVAKTFEKDYKNLVEHGFLIKDVYHPGTPDRIVQDVIKKLDIRSTIGVQKYKTTLDDNNYDNFLEHAQEEMLDGALYLQKLIDQRKNDWAYTRDFWLTLKRVVEYHTHYVDCLPDKEDVDKLLKECDKHLKPQIENL